MKKPGGLRRRRRGLRPPHYLPFFNPKSLNDSILDFFGMRLERLCPEGVRLMLGALKACWSGGPGPLPIISLSGSNHTLIQVQLLQALPLQFADKNTWKN
jgi:hypothetical protein